MKPMLAKPVPEDLDQLRFPFLVSPKLDGVRCLITQDAEGSSVPLSRTLKLIPNRHIQQCFREAGEILNFLDGELIVGSPTAPDCLRKTMSAVMSHDGEPDFVYHVFDIWQRVATSYSQSYLQLLHKQSSLPSWIKVLEHTPVESVARLESEEEDIVSQGYEGVILRNPQSPYKFGRSTVREAGMLKLKRFQTDEATVIGTVELLRNLNEPQLDNLGHTKRSSHQNNKVPGDTLGALVCQRPDGQVFEIGTGFTEELRLQLWQTRLQLPGMIVTYKHFPVGVKDKPRHAVFLSFRDPRDL